MILKITNLDYEFDIKNICTIFFPYEKIKPDGESDIVVSAEKRGDKILIDAKVYDRYLSKEYVIDKSEDMAIAVSRSLYEVLSQILGFSSPWGILFGVRPAKLMHRLCDETSLQEAKDYFVNTLLTSPAKAELTAEVMKNENKIISLSKRNSFSLYISIPFCPTRCSYCSFVSHSIERTKPLIEPYIQLLCRELVTTAEIAKNLGLRLESIYFGGGTPTTLDEQLLSQLFDTVEKNFDLSLLREYTVEAGRPDTVNLAKLKALKSAGVSRISINPQSFNDRVLEKIGRKHTCVQTLDAYNLAVQCGFDNINMDFIAGLPADSLDSFKHSIDKAVELDAQSITVHTLALKSAAYIVTKDLTFDLSDRITTAQMVDYSDKTLSFNSYYPYYMYKQSKSIGNLENVGWCKNGKDCLYNVFMMDETHSVFAVGAGAVTRLKNSDTGSIERIYNFKYPYEYIDRFDEILARKEKIYNFYS